MIGIAVLGSTGSVGENTLDVLARHRERFSLVAIAAHTNAAKLARQILTWQPRYAALANEAAVAELRELLGARAPNTRVLAGPGALEQLAALSEVQCVMAAIVGAAGLRSTLAAARAGKRLLLANKESLVMAGPLLVAAVFLVIQQVESNTLVPVVMNRVLSLPPLTVVLALLVGGTLEGVAGALLAVPVAAAVQVLVLRIAVPMVHAMQGRREQAEAELTPRPREPAPPAWWRRQLARRPGAR